MYLEYDRKTKKIDKFTINKKAVKDDNTYKLGLQKYHFINMQEGFNITLDELEKNSKSRVVATSCRDVIEEYLSNNQLLDIDIEENPRLVVKK